MPSNNASSQSNTPYKPTDMGRLFWLAAKNINVPDPEFSHKDNVRFALGLYSGCYVNHIQLSDMVDCVINALTHYYQHAGIRDHELKELFKPLRTDYARLINEKWDQDQASEKIISACMNRLMLAQVSDGGKLLVDLSGPEVNYDEVFEKFEREVTREQKEEDERIFEKCRCDGEAKCLRLFNDEWLYKISDEEKGAMKADECLCEKVVNRNLSFDCDFKVERDSLQEKQASMIH